MDIEQMRIRMGEMAAEIERLNAYIDQLLDPNSEPSLGVAISKTENTTQSPAVAVPKTLSKQLEIVSRRLEKDGLWVLRDTVNLAIAALQSPRITEQDAREILESFCKFGHYSSDIGAFLCDSIFRELLDKLNGANHE